MSKKVEESPRHLRYKLRLCKIFRDRGFKAETERPFPCYVELGDFYSKYKVDVYATKGNRKIIAEVDGPVGHSNTIDTVRRKGVRRKRIKQSYGKEMEIYYHPFERFVHWSDQEIAEEMRL